MIRAAIPTDIETVVAIYNQAISAGFQTAFTEPQSVEERAVWFTEHLNSRYPVFVYLIDEKIVGWFSISPYRSGRAALRFTVEISYFIDAAYQGRGIGSALLTYGIRACKDLGYKTALAIILDKNTASIKLMEKFGFQKWAELPGVADFDGVECGHVYYGLNLVK